ncbi:hypothetical protein GCM10010460_08870 [Microbacterium terrae]|nr:hypothetical protein GCM10017594_20370 [Microbacterium terrae]
MSERTLRPQGRDDDPHYEWDEVEQRIHGAVPRESRALPAGQRRRRRLRLGTPVSEVAEHLGDEAHTVLAVYAHILGEDQRRDHAERLARAEERKSAGDPWGTPDPDLGPSTGNMIF